MIAVGDDAPDFTLRDQNNELREEVHRGSELVVLAAATTALLQAALLMGGAFVVVACWESNRLVATAKTRARNAGFHIARPAF